MNFFKLYIPLFFIWGLSSCSQSNTASTEVENEIQVSQISGTVATGAAMAKASLQFFDAELNVVGEVQADELGEYEIDPRTYSDLPFLIKAISQDNYDTLLTLVVLSEDDSSLIIHINPLTNRLSLELMAEFGRVRPNRVLWESRGDQMLGQLYGGQVPFSLYSNQPQFNAWVPGSIRPPSPQDILLHTLGDFARLKGISPDSLIIELQSSNGLPLLEQSEFQEQMVSKLITMGVDSAEAMLSLRMWMSGLEDLEELSQDYMTRRPLQNPNLPPHDLPSMVFQVLNNHLEMNPLSVSIIPLQPLIFDIASRSILGALVELKDSLWTQQGGNRLRPLIQELSLRSIEMLSGFTPEEYRSQITWISDVLIQQIETQIMVDLDLTLLWLDESGTYFQTNYRGWNPEAVMDSVVAGRAMRGGTEVGNPIIPGGN
jgi:hypothetical protein